jgi:hypothetical protein
LQGKISGANNLTNIGRKFSVFFEIMNMCKREKNINKKRGLEIKSKGENSDRYTKK